MVDRSAIARWLDFEFMDQPWIPESLHATLREVLGFHLRVTLGYYYRWAAMRTLERTRTLELGRVMELGAGAAGFSEALARLVLDSHAAVKVDVSDLRPNVERYRLLERAFPGVIAPHLDPVDFLTGDISEDALVVFSAAFHHVPVEERLRVLTGLKGRHILIFESVTRNAASMLGCAIGFLPALATPLYFVGTPDGRWRRFFWCWLLPVAPLMVAWDGVVSCFRCWTEDEWRDRLRAIGVNGQTITIERRRFSHMIGW